MKDRLQTSDPLQEVLGHDGHLVENIASLIAFEGASVHYEHPAQGQLDLLLSLTSSGTNVNMLRGYRLKQYLKLLRDLGKEKIFLPAMAAGFIASSDDKLELITRGRRDDLPALREIALRLKSPDTVAGEVILVGTLGEIIEDMEKK